MTDTSAALVRLDNVSPPPFRARMSTSRSGGAAAVGEDRTRIEYAAADRWKVTDGDRVTLRNGARVWTVLPDRVFIQRADRVAPPFLVLLWSSYRSKDYRVDGLEAVELDDGRPGWLAAVSYHSGATTAQLELLVDQGSGLLRHRKESAATGASAVEVALDAVDYAPVFDDHAFEPVIASAAQVFDECDAADPGAARRILIGLVARAAIRWNRIRHPERR